MNAKYADLIRKRFEIINDEYQRYSEGKVYAEPSKIRIEVPLVNGVGRYQFNIKKQDIANQREVSLDRNDVFIPNFIGLFLAVQNNTKPSCEQLLAYPAINDGVNPSVYGAGFTSGEVEAIYNGKLTWLIDNGILLSSYPTERFKHVPETQGAFVLKSDDTDVNEGILPEWDILDSCDLLVPKITIAGTRDHNVSLNFDASNLSFAVTAGHTPVLVFYLDGFLIKGGCEFFDANNPNAKAVGRWG